MLHMVKKAEGKKQIKIETLQLIWITTYKPY